jgi:hypothetical protein
MTTSSVRSLSIEEGLDARSQAMFSVHLIKSKFVHYLRSSSHDICGQLYTPPGRPVLVVMCADIPNLPQVLQQSYVDESGTFVR